jgi:hypothetical protein
MFVQAMEPAYEELAAHMAGSPVVTVAKYQADIDREFCNEKLQLKTFPTIVYLPPNSTQVRSLARWPGPPPRTPSTSVDSHKLNVTRHVSRRCCLSGLSIFPERCARIQTLSVSSWVRSTAGHQVPQRAPRRGDPVHVGQVRGGLLSGVAGRWRAGPGGGGVSAALPGLACALCT